MEDGIPSPRSRTMLEQTTGLVDYTMIKSWIDVCAMYHGSKCEGVHLSEGDDSVTIPVYLIDLKTRKITEAQQGTRYVAVSYVWGSDVTNDNSTSVVPSHSNHESRGIFNTNMERRLPERLPQTLEDVLILAEAIGERFVWIDRYCIDQNNKVEVDEQVSSMDRIFRQACLTIIALASDDVNSGVAGISRPMQQRMQPILSLPQGKLTATSIEFTRERSGNFPWDQRAWTLQEFVLSRRCLIFSDYHVSMMCQEEFFHDIIPVNTSADRSQTKLDQENWWENVYAIDLEGKEWDFKAYEGLVSIYSGRQLRYQSDVLRACEGTLNYITQNTDMKFTFGMPVQDLHRALLWKAHNEVTLKRRHWHGENGQTWISFPSWTWAGWQGRTECDYWIGDMAGYVGQDVNDGIKILNRKSRKKPRLTDIVLEPHPSLRQAEIMTYPQTNEIDKPFLKVISDIATCKVHCIRRDSVRYQTFKNGARKESLSAGDHWTLLEPDTGYKMRDIAGEEEVFDKRDHFFRTHSGVSEEIERRGCQVELLMVSHWPLIRDSEQSNTWLQDMVSCLVILRNDDKTAWRIAAILLELDTWASFTPVSKKVELV